MPALPPLIVGGELNSISERILLPISLCPLSYYFYKTPAPTPLINIPPPLYFEPARQQKKENAKLPNICYSFSKTKISQSSCFETDICSRKMFAYHCVPY